MKKRIIPITLVLCMTLPLLTGCLQKGTLQPEPQAAQAAASQNTQPAQLQTSQAEPTRPTEAWGPEVLASAFDAYGYHLYFYNEAGQLVREEDANHNVGATYTYHDNGAVATKTEGDRITEYDTHGNPTALYHCDGVSAPQYEEFYANTYDPQGRLTETITTDPYGGTQETIRYTYEADGTVQIFYELGNFCGPNSTEFVPYMRRTGWFTPEGEMVRKDSAYSFGEPDPYQEEYIRNEHGDVTEYRYRCNKKTLGIDEFESIYIYYEHTYDNQGRLLTTTARTTHYLNQAGVETKETNPLSSSVAYSYDDQGRRILARTAQMDMPDSVTVWEYDAYGNVIHQETTYSDWDYVEEAFWEYDSQGRLLRREGLIAMSDRDYFLYGTGSQTVYMEEEYTYLPLSQVLAEF